MLFKVSSGSPPTPTHTHAVERRKALRDAVSIFHTRNKSTSKTPHSCKKTVHCRCQHISLQFSSKVSREKAERRIPPTPTPRKGCPLPRALQVGGVSSTPGSSPSKLISLLLCAPSFPAELEVFVLSHFNFQTNFPISQCRAPSPHPTNPLNAWAAPHSP